MRTWQPPQISVAVVPQLYCRISPASPAQAHRNLYVEGKITSGRAGACSCPRQLLLLLGGQHVCWHPEVVTGGTPQRHMIDRTTGARQREAIGDLGRDEAFRARYESQH
jgi:hypothetical protein